MNARVYDVVSRRGTYYATVCRQPAAADGHDFLRAVPPVEAVARLI